jgi:hypothetical protein
MDTPHHLYDRATQDVGNLVEFGHVNTRVPDQRIATLFYVTGLGLTRDPYLMTSTDNMWINVGRCQFHLPTGEAQVLRGIVGLVMPDLDALERRLTRVRTQLAGTQFDFSRAGDAILATSPWGNRLRIHAPDPARFRDTALGMPYVELTCPPGSAAGIVRFYREMMGTPAHLESHTAHVPVGLAEELRYVETDTEQAPYDGNHIQVTLADFSGPYRRLLERGLISEESDESQYRFLDIVDPKDGRALLRIEHEVRSMRHPMFARVLVNRNPDINNRNFVPGAETADWALQP